MYLIAEVNCVPRQSLSVTARQTSDRWPSLPHGKMVQPFPPHSLCNETQAWATINQPKVGTSQAGRLKQSAQIHAMIKPEGVSGFPVSNQDVFGPWFNSQVTKVGNAGSAPPLNAPPLPIFARFATHRDEKVVAVFLCRKCRRAQGASSYGARAVERRQIKTARLGRSTTSARLWKDSKLWGGSVECGCAARRQF